MVTQSSLATADDLSSAIPALRLDGLGVDAGDFRVRDVNFQIPKGRWCVLMGRTGTGKTTLLDTICGLRRPTEGSIWIEGTDVTQFTPGDRGIGYVPQDGALFTRSTVRQHLEFGLTVGRRPRILKTEIARRVDELAILLGISHLLKRRPRGLSGGERQRVALGRALAHQPSLLLLDEPLSALDDETREEMYDLIRRLRKETEVTALHVTHSREEANQLADMSLRFHDGKLSTIPHDAQTETHRSRGESA